MAIQTIPFRDFMMGYSSVTPDPGILSMVDGGLTFFVGTGAVLLTLVAAEKMGFPINESVVRLFVLTGAVLGILWAVLKNPLFRSLVVGF